MLTGWNIIIAHAMRIVLVDFMVLRRFILCEFCMLFNHTHCYLPIGSPCCVTDYPFINNSILEINLTKSEKFEHVFDQVYSPCTCLKRMEFGKTESEMSQIVNDMLQ